MVRDLRNLLKNDPWKAYSFVQCRGPLLLRDVCRSAPRFESQILSSTSKQVAGFPFTAVMTIQIMGWHRKMRPILRAHWPHSTYLAFWIGHQMEISISATSSLNGSKFCRSERSSFKNWLAILSLGPAKGIFLCLEDSFVWPSCWSSLYHISSDHKSSQLQLQIAQNFLPPRKVTGHR